MAINTRGEGSSLAVLSYDADLCGNIEQALKGLQGYGIMALELIQNADDAGASSLTFDVTPESLIVRNSAEFTSCGLSEAQCPWERTGDPEGLKRPCNFHAISRMGGRSKVHAENQTGRFGIGFVSVYQLTDTPIVRSVGTQIVLNPYTREVPATPVERTSGTEFEFPWASSPSAVRSAINASPTPPDVVTRVVTEVQTVLRSSLLFLRNLKHVEVRERGAVRLGVEIDRRKGEIELRFSPEETTERWLVLSRAADDVIAAKNLFADYEILQKLKRAKLVSVAIPLDGELPDGLLFAYLPTQHKTGMPMHLNADFFPHSSRQEIVLKGEGHERHWNEALIAAAAAIIGENLEFLRDRLGHVRLWQLGADAFRLRSESAFGAFWTQFAAAARAIESVWTTAGVWRHPEPTYMAAESLTVNEQAALSGLDFDLLHPALRQHWTPLSSVGVKELRLQAVVTRLVERGGEGITDGNPHLRVLWGAISKLIAGERQRRDPLFDAVRGRLGDATFLIDIDGDPATPNQLWRTPEGVNAIAIRRFVSDCPLVHQDVLVHPELAELIDIYGLDDFAADLAKSITSPEDAADVIGTDPSGAQSLYALMMRFDHETTSAGEILADTPMLRTKEGFVEPSKAQLPGGFEDPIGRFEFIDTSVFPPGTEQFLGDALGVSILDFHNYLDQHLEEILDTEPTREQYVALLSLIAMKGPELEASGSLAVLANRAFVRNRAGAFVRPRECYYWSRALGLILGEDVAKWVDEEWMPRDLSATTLRGILEFRLGMPTTVSPRHIVDRISELAEENSPEEIERPLTSIVRHLLENWQGYSQEELEILGELREIEFLPAHLNEQLDREALYAPSDVYRAIRYRGFVSQVPVVALAPLRLGTSNELLDFLGVPSEPPTSVIVAHLKHCIATGSEPNDVTFAMLSERLDRNDNVSAIDTLRGSAFIFNAENRQFLRAGQVFWQQSPVAGYWWRASSSMWQREALYRRLGVRDAPEPSDYAALLLEIAGESDQQARNVYAYCMAYLCEAVGAGNKEAAEATEALSEERSLINRCGEPIYPEHAVWVDAEQLAAPFGTDLDACLVSQPVGVDRTSAAQFFRLLGVAPISQLAHQLLAEEPDRNLDEAATELLRERADLIRWLVPIRSWRSLADVLPKVRILTSEMLRIRTEMPFEEPVLSPPSAVTAFLEANDLHVEEAAFRRGWFAAFRALFAIIDQDGTVDIAPMVAIASQVMRFETPEDAEFFLRESGFAPPGAWVVELAEGEALGDGVMEKEPEEESADEAYEGQPQGGVDEEGPAEDEPHDQTEEPAQLEQDASRNGGRFDTAGRTSSPSRSPEPADTEGDYGSKSGKDDFGATDPTAEPIGANGAGNQAAPHGGRTQGAGQVGGKTRTERMVSYVTRSGDREGDDADAGRSDADISNLIDIGAIRAAMRYEERHGRSPKEQPHTNPGYDIISVAADGSRRIIEVKGMDGEWTDRGTKMSRTQYSAAAQHQEEYWLYVVENARDQMRQRLYAIQNPFQQVDEYWFDRNWREAAEERRELRDVNIQRGTRVRHVIWGEGTVVSVNKRGIADEIIVDYGDRTKSTRVVTDLTVIE